MWSFYWNCSLNNLASIDLFALSFSLSLFLAFIPFQLPAFTLSLSLLSVRLCMHRHSPLSSISPFPYLLFSLTNLAQLPWQPLVSPLSQCIPQVCVHGQCHSHALCPAPKRQQSHVTKNKACVTRMRSGPRPSKSSAL